MIEIDNLSYMVRDGNSDRVILDEVTTLFKRGEVTAITGPSGSGKTSLLYAIAGFLDKNISGKILIDNVNVGVMKQREREKFRLDNIGFIYQNLNLFPFLSVRENILLPLKIRGFKIDDCEIEKYINYFSLDYSKIINKKVNQLSGGEQQRIAIVRTVIGGQKILLCDEPTANMDEKNRNLFVDLMLSAARGFNQCIVVVSHDRKVVESCDKIYYLNYGKLEEYGGM